MNIKKISAATPPETPPPSFSLAKAIVLYLAVSLILKVYQKLL